MEGGVGVMFKDTGEALFHAILCDPDKDDLRLIYADYLEDQGDHQRAEFVRVGCELSQLPECLLTTVDDGTGDPGGHVCRCRWHTLRHREQDLLAQHWPRWTSETFGTRKVSAAGNLDAIRVVLDGAELDVAYRRGFISTARLPLEVWIGQECSTCLGLKVVNRPERFKSSACWMCHGLGRTGAHGSLLVAAAPLERVEVSDREPCGPLEHGPWVGMWFWLKRDFPLCLWPFIQPDPGMIASEYYDSKDTANAVLSDALLTWAKEQPCNPLSVT